MDNQQNIFLKYTHNNNKLVVHNNSTVRFTQHVENTPKTIVGYLHQRSVVNEVFNFQHKHIWSFNMKILENKIM